MSRTLMAVAGRIAGACLLILAVVTLNFTLIKLAPGDPVEAIAGAAGGMSEELRAQIRATYGLDRSFLEQLVAYLKQIFSGNLGFSYYFNQPVSELILQRLPATMLLVFSALVISVVLGVLLGVLAARKPDGLLSQSVTVLSLVGYAAPVFWTGILLTILFASTIPIFPISGMRDAGMEGGMLDSTLDVLWHLVLPAITLGIVYLAQYSRLTRASMLEVLGADYIRTARAKGVGEFALLSRHALRNAMLPVVTMIGMQFGNMIAGAVLVETVFNWPGLGRLAFDSILRRDYPTILAILACSAALTIVANALTDLLYQRIDPRMKEGR
ncbi:ABC transporter permease [Mesorhizobium sp. SP-1A]|uniref:ABC transporter permease n=1 Tax=Mesorhizobium sp. SP-1A TaxID=3077840 RepID=UPI0028F7067E|nr:ABC transporter permease [Mesorhizobium sp. SP-1A]